MPYGDPPLRRPKPPFVPGAIWGKQSPDAGRIGEQIRRERIDRRTRFRLQQEFRPGMSLPRGFSLFDTRIRTDIPSSKSYWRDYILPRMEGTRPSYTRGLLSNR